MKKYEAASSRELLSAHGQLDRSWVYTPIASWSNDDVWLFLNQYKNPWGYTNKNLLGMYQGATEDGECPLVVDTSTPSCGDSRFGCYVCTLVEKDKSMHAMIQNDEEKSRYTIFHSPVLSIQGRIACASGDLCWSSNPLIPYFSTRCLKRLGPLGAI